MSCYCGIDYSMSCPAITIGTKSDYTKCKSFFYTKKKKHEGKFDTNIFGMMELPYESQMERFHNIAEWTISILKEFKVSEACIEGYSMGSKGNVFNIGENTGIMKHVLWTNNINFYTPAPTQVKKEFSGKGNANKIIMHESFVEKTGINISSIFQQKPDSNPVSDIVDSYAMLEYGLKHHF